MAITLTKTLPQAGTGETYTLHIMTQVQVHTLTQVVVDMAMYEGQDYYEAGFYPILHKQHNLTDAALCSMVASNYDTNYAMAVQVIETYLVQNDPWYQGGTVALEG